MILSGSGAVVVVSIDRKRPECVPTSTCPRGLIPNDRTSRLVRPSLICSQVSPSLREKNTQGRKVPCCKAPANRCPLELMTSISTSVFDKPSFAGCQLVPLSTERKTPSVNRTNTVPFSFAPRNFQAFPKLPNRTVVQLAPPLV